MITWCIKMRFIFLIFLSLVTSYSSLAQSGDEYGILPSLNLNKKFNHGWAVNLKLESRQVFYQNELNYDYKLSDPSLALAKKLSAQSTLVAGYLMRFEGSEIIHRSIQQWTLIQQPGDLKFAHRFASDQTYEDKQSTEWRLRYRIATEIPLRGRSLDVDESYVKINHEYLNSFQEKEHDLEIRAIAFYGYVLNLNSKVEIGLDYRADSFINHELRSRLWLALNFYHSI